MFRSKKKKNNNNKNRALCSFGMHGAPSSCHPYPRAPSHLPLWCRHCRWRLLTLWACRVCCAQVTSTKAPCSQHHQADQYTRQTRAHGHFLFLVRSLLKCTLEDWRCWSSILLSTEPAYPQADKHMPGVVRHTAYHLPPQTTLFLSLFFPGKK